MNLTFAKALLRLAGILLIQAAEIRNACLKVFFQTGIAYFGIMPRDQFKYSRSIQIQHRIHRFAVHPHFEMQFGAIGIAAAHRCNLLAGAHRLVFADQ